MEAEGGAPRPAMDSSNPLLKAVFLRRLRLTRLLLEGGAYVNESDGQGRTPLMVACTTRHADAQSAGRDKLVQFLLEKGADPNIQDKEGRSALMHACWEQAGPAVAALLLASGADVGLEDRSGTSALVYAVMAGDWAVLKLLLDTCKAKGKEVIIIATDKFPCGKVQAERYLGLPPLDPLGGTDGTASAAPASPSEIQLITSPMCASSSLRPPTTVFSFKDAQSGGVSSHPCSPSRFQRSGQAAPNGLQQSFLRLNSEPWLKVPASLLRQQPQARDPAEDPPLRTAEPRAAPDNGAEVKYGCAKDVGPKISFPGLLSSHSASHPNLHSANLGADLLPSSSSPSSRGGGKHPGAPLHAAASSSLRSIIQRRRLGDIYSSDPQLARDVHSLPEESQQGARGDLTAQGGKRLAPLRCSSTLGSLEAGPSRRVLSGFERRGSGAFLFDHGSQAKPRSLPPLAPNYAKNAGVGSCEKQGSAARSLLPCAPPGHPKEMTRRRLLRRHSMQTEPFKTTA